MRFHLTTRVSIQSGLAAALPKRPMASTKTTSEAHSVCPVLSDPRLQIDFEVRCRGFGRLGGAEPHTPVSGFIHPGILVHWTSAL